MSETAFDGAWRSLVVEALGVPADHAFVCDLQTIIEQWHLRRASRTKPEEAHASRDGYKAALKHFRSMAAALTRARGTNSWNHTDTIPLYGKLVAPGVAMASIEAYLKFHAANGSGRRATPNSADSLVIHQIAGIWEAAGKAAPKSWDVRSGEFSRFVEIVAGRVSKRAADRGLERYFKAREIYAARNYHPIANQTPPPA
jgi:hypothetical protein